MHRNRKRKRGQPDSPVEPTELDLAWDDWEKCKTDTRPNDASMAMVYKVAGTVWRTSFARSCYPVPRSAHKCDPAYCDLEQLVLDYILGPPENGDERPSHSLLHMCVRVKRGASWVVHETMMGDDASSRVIARCAGKHQYHDEKSGKVIDAEKEAKYRGTLEELYVCSKTGHMHLCTPTACDYGTNPEHNHGDSVCKLTGKVLSERQSVSEYWLPKSVKMSSGESWLASDNGTRKGAGSGKKGVPPKSFRPYMSSNQEDPIGEFFMLDDMSFRDIPTCDHSKIREYIKFRRRKRSTKRNPYREYLTTAVMRISLLFSRTRYLIDMDIASEAMRLANRDVHKQLRSGVGDDALSLKTTQLHALRNRNVPDNLVLSRQDRQNFFLSYAKRTLQLWAIVRTRTKTGADSPNQFPFMEFVISAMYIFKSGIYLPPNVTNGPGEQLLQPDVLLQQCLPRYDIIERLDCDRQTTRKVKKATLQAIMLAVREERVNTSQLHPTSIHPENLPADIYRNLRRNRQKS